ncbi:Multidrug/oligosaccharidyl-lipid/polysaccharide, partial [Globisporangium splendens]
MGPRIPKRSKDRLTLRQLCSCWHGGRVKSSAAPYVDMAGVCAPLVHGGAGESLDGSSRRAHVHRLDLLGSPGGSGTRRGVARAGLDECAAHGGLGFSVGIDHPLRAIVGRWESRVDGRVAPVWRDHHECPLVPVFIWYWCLGYVLEYSTDDPRVIGLAARQYFQALGILLPTTVVGVTSICTAIATNYVFIYGLGGAWSGLGFIGSPLSTVFASWFQPTALFLYNCDYRKYHLRAWGDWNRKTLTLCRFKAFTTIAGPIAGNSFASNLANALVSLVAAKLGAQTIAANAVISGMWGMLWALSWGYGCATQVRVANYLGTGEPQRAQQVARLGFLCTFIVVSLLAVVTSRFDRDVVAIYTNDEQLMATCQQVLPIFICVYFLESIEMLCGGVLTGMSQVKVIFWTSTIATWCINVPVAYVGGITLGFGFPALWCGVLFMEIVKLLTYATCLVRRACHGGRTRGDAGRAREMHRQLHHGRGGLAADGVHRVDPRVAHAAAQHRVRAAEEDGAARAQLQLPTTLVTVAMIQKSPISKMHDEQEPVGKWAQRKEAKRNMYLTSTDNVRVARRGGSGGASASAAQCQKCLKTGHWTYECKNDAVYLKRASRSQQLKNPKLRQPFNEDKPPVTAKEEEELQQKQQTAALRKQGKKSSDKTKKKSRTSVSKTRRKHKYSSSDSDSSSSDSSSDSDSDSSSGSSSSGSDSYSDSSSSSSSSSSGSSSSSDDSSSEDESPQKHRSKRRRKD